MGAKGAYTIYGAETGTPDCIIIGTGSEVPLCIDAAKVLEGEGKTVRVVSMPCWELYDAQSAEYKERPAGRLHHARVGGGRVDHGLGQVRWRVRCRHRA